MKRIWSRRLAGFYGVFSLAIVAYLVWVPRNAEITIDVLSGGGSVLVNTLSDGAELTQSFQAPGRLKIPSGHFLARVYPMNGQYVRVHATIRSATRARVHASIEGDEELQIRGAGAKVHACGGRNCLNDLRVLSFKETLP